MAGDNLWADVSSDSQDQDKEENGKKKDQTDTNSKCRRLEKNRLSAKESRLRKKYYM